jgi:hypothetical protein
MLFNQLSSRILPRASRPLIKTLLGRCLNGHPFGFSSLLTAARGCIPYCTRCFKAVCSGPSVLAPQGAELLPYAREKVAIDKLPTCVQQLKRKLDVAEATVRNVRAANHQREPMRPTPKQPLATLTSASPRAPKPPDRPPSQHVVVPPRKGTPAYKPRNWGFLAEVPYVLRCQWCTGVSSKRSGCGNAA